MYVLASIADVRGKHMTTVTLVQLRYACLHNTFITAVVLLALFPYDSYCVKKAVEGFEEHNHIYSSKVNGVYPWPDAPVTHQRVILNRGTMSTVVDPPDEHSHSSSRSSQNGPIFSRHYFLRCWLHKMRVVV